MNETNLRAVVTTIDAELEQLSSLPAGSIPASSIVELQNSWSKLVGILALGPEPAVRVCPTCANTVMRAAIRCGFCWSRLRPPESNGS